MEHILLSFSSTSITLIHFRATTEHSRKQCYITFRAKLIRFIVIYVLPVRGRGEIKRNTKRSSQLKSIHTLLSRIIGYRYSLCSRLQTHRSNSNTRDFTLVLFIVTDSSRVPPCVAFVHKPSTLLIT